MAGPKVKFTEETILEKTISFVEASGFEQLNARNLATYIGCSTQPIFRVFDSMENLKQALFHKMEQIYDGYMALNTHEENPFLGMGIGYIRFATERKNLFKAMFFSEYFKKASMLAFFEDDESKEIIQMIATATGISFQNASELLRNIWLLTHGIASMLATNEITYSEEEIKVILGQSFSGYLLYFKEKKDETNN